MYLKLIMLVAVIGVIGGGYAYHQVTVSKLETAVVQLEANNRTLKENQVQLQLAAETQAKALRDMEANARKSEAAMTELTQRNNELNKEKSIYYLNLVDNEIIEYAFSPILNDINLEKSVISNSSNLIFYKSEDNNDIINIIPREYILFNEKSIGKLYYNKVNLAFVIPILFILSTFMVILMSLNRGKTLLITENGIRLNNRFSELNKKSIQLIKKIINENKISTYEVNEILFDNSLSRASNYHIKSNIFEEINTKFYYITNSNKKLIINSKSKFDKRMINFKINKDLNLKFKIK